MAMPVFQFTHPVRGATLRLRGLVRRSDVSIHAPREGCDVVDERVACEGPVFQFTHPVRGATKNLVRVAELAEVSIHAPREGCDCIRQRSAERT